jgi:hypothetical protein
MRKRLIDTTVYGARNMQKDGNIDYGYWHDKSNEEKLKAAFHMIVVAFREPLFKTKKVDRAIFSARKRDS